MSRATASACAWRLGLTSSTRIDCDRSSTITRAAKDVSSGCDCSRQLGPAAAAMPSDNAAVSSQKTLRWPPPVPLPAARCAYSGASQTRCQAERACRRRAIIQARIHASGSNSNTAG